MRKFIKKVILFGILAALVFWGIAVLKCEIYTASHASEFEDEYVQEDIVVPADSIKILFYSDEYAQVYYECGDRADIIDFRYRDKKWYLMRRVSVKEEGDSRPKRFVWPYLWYYLL